MTRYICFELRFSSAPSHGLAERLRELGLVLGDLYDETRDKLGTRILDDESWVDLYREGHEWRMVAYSLSPTPRSALLEYYRQAKGDLGSYVEATEVTSGGVGTWTNSWRRPEMKKLVNKPDNLVMESLQGFAVAHANLVRVAFAPDYVVRSGAPIVGKVALVSGSGSGHEPAHIGFVGRGMLDAACPGDVFTSPTPDQILEATRAVHGGAGVLYIVTNYTGDVMNFEMAADMARSEGIEVISVLIDDDVAVQDSLYTAGRRGVGTSVIAEKIAGGAADEGRLLGDVAEIARRVNANGRSMGVALTSLTIPAVGRPAFQLGEDEMEFGVGIHGEPGRARTKLRPAAEVVEMIASAVVDDLPFEWGDSVLALVNGMGGTPLIELYIVYNELNRFLGSGGITIDRNLIGTYITSLEMAGCSITLLKLDDELKRLWDTPVETAALRWGASDPRQATRPSPSGWGAGVDFGPFRRPAM